LEQQKVFFFLVALLMLHCIILGNAYDTLKILICTCLTVIYKSTLLFCCYHMTFHF